MISPLLNFNPNHDASGRFSSGGGGGGGGNRFKVRDQKREKKRASFKKKIKSGLTNKDFAEHNGHIELASPDLSVVIRALPAGDSAPIKRYFYGGGDGNDRFSGGGGAMAKAPALGGKKKSQIKLSQEVLRRRLNKVSPKKQADLARAMKAETGKTKFTAPDGTITKINKDGSVNVGGKVIKVRSALRQKVRGALVEGAKGALEGGVKSMATAAALGVVGGLYAAPWYEQNFGIQDFPGGPRSGFKLFGREYTPPAQKDVLAKAAGHAWKAGGAGAVLGFARGARRGAKGEKVHVHTRTKVAGAMFAVAGFQALHESGMLGDFTKHGVRFPGRRRLKYPIGGRFKKKHKTALKYSIGGRFKGRKPPPPSPFSLNEA